MGRKTAAQQAAPGRVALPGGSRLARAGVAALLPLFGCLLLGDLVWSLKERAVQELVKIQLRDFSQNVVLLNIMFGAVPALLIMLAGPPVGAWSDRTRTRFGRRIPFLLAGAPLLALFLAALAYSEPIADALLALSGAGAAYRSATVVGCMVVFWILFDLMSILGNALFIALINDTVPRHLLGRFFGLFRIVSLAVGAVFFEFVFGSDTPAVARHAMLGIALAYLAGFLVVGFGVREPAYPPPAALPYRRGMGRLRVSDADDPRFYRLLFAAAGLAAVCLLSVNINAYNAIGQFGVNRADYGSALAVTYCISIALALPLGWLADRIHPLRIARALMAVYGVAMAGAWLLVDGRTSFLAGLVVHGVLAGSYLTGTAALLPSLLPRERFSELAAMSLSVSALMVVLFTLALGGLLDWSGRDFRWMFLAGGVMALGAAAMWNLVLRVHRQRCAAGQAHDTWRGLA